MSLKKKTTKKQNYKTEPRLTEQNDKQLLFLRTKGLLSFVFLITSQPSNVGNTV